MIRDAGSFKSIICNFKPIREYGNHPDYFCPEPYAAYPSHLSVMVLP